MASDCAIHLKDYNVAFVSLWPGLVRTEEMMNSKETGQIDESVSSDFAFSFVFKFKIQILIGVFFSGFSDPKQALRLKSIQTFRIICLCSCFQELKEGQTFNPRICCNSINYIDLDILSTFILINILSGVAA